jgi:hypothetical protein
VKTYVDGSITTLNTATTAAIAAVQADVNLYETASNAADVVLQGNITTLQGTVTSNAAATTTALGQKENAANKSTITTLGTSDVLFPTQNAVKTYVDASVSAGTAGLNNEAAIRAAADQLLTNNLANEAAARAAADVVLTNNITAEEAARTAADLLKENISNKSININLDAASDIKFPSVKAVKTYVDTYSLTNSISTISSNYTLAMTDYTILTNSTMGAFTLTLPNAASATGKVYVIRKIDETNNLLNFSPALKLTETTLISSINFPKTIRIQSNGTSWYVID